MSRLTPIPWKILEAIFLKDGWQFHKQKGSHRSYTKQGFFRPVVIPTYNAVGIDIIMSNMKTAGMNRERYFKLLAECSG